MLRHARGAVDRPDDPERPTPKTTGTLRHTGSDRVKVSEGNRRTDVHRLTGFSGTPLRPTSFIKEVSDVKKFVHRFAGAVGWLAMLLMAAGAGWKPH
jgi:hypothetical protein